MFKDGDTLKAVLKVPLKSEINLIFWITENNQGQVQDSWDTIERNIKVVDAQPVTYTPSALGTPEKAEPAGILNRGWVLLLIIGVFF